MTNAGTITVTGPRGKPVSFRVSYTVREFDPSSADGSARMGRIHAALHGGRSPAELLASLRTSRSK